MKKNLSLILIFAMLFGTVCLSSCMMNGKLVIVSGEEAFYAIYREFSASESDKNAVLKLRDTIRSTTGTNMIYTTDRSTDTEDELSKLLVGNTDREETKKASENLGENQIRICAVGDTVCIVSGNSYCLGVAVDKFIELYVTEDGVSVPKNVDRTWNCVEAVDSYTVENPINISGNDPDVVEHNGMYYYCWSSNGVSISTAPSIDKISLSGAKRVYSAPANTMYSSEYWAPELHYIQGEWYIYVAADDGKDENHKMYVLKGKTQDPLDGFEMIGKISDPSDKWAIDGTVVTIKDELYFVWSGWQGDNDSGHQNLYIAHMSDPTTIDSERTLISTPTYGWEGPLNEGPYAAYHGDDVFVLFSANGSWADNYCISYLKLTNPDAPLDAQSWEKASVPILAKSSDAYGPGHCSVAPAADGSYWMIYHANLESGTGWGGRSVWIQKLEFDENGNPEISAPQKTVSFPMTAWRTDGEVLA